MGCESGGQQFNEDGSLVVGEAGEVGKYQIMPDIWMAEARQLGYDICTEDGNERMAFHIWKEYGTEPWSCSEIIHKAPQ